MTSRLFLMAVGIAALSPVSVVLGTEDVASCADEVVRESAVVAATDHSAARDLVADQGWHIVASSERRRFHSMPRAWPGVVLVSVMRASSADRMSVTECDGRLLVRNLDLCPDDSGTPVYLWVKADPPPRAYVFAWKDVGREDCRRAAP
jgi:hypothetical protein